MRRGIERILWSVALASLCAVALASWREWNATTVGDGRASSFAVALAPRAASTWLADSIAADADRVARTDAFRFARKPATTAFVPVPIGPPAAGTPTPPKPQLVLAGIVGPPWQGLVEGFPGREGAVLAREGELFGVLRVKVISRDSIVIAGSDTTWRLGLKRGWQ